MSEKNKHARDALIEAYTLCDDAEEARKTAIEDPEEREAYVNGYRRPHVRQLFNGLNLVLSADVSREVRSWDDVLEMLPGFVAERMPADVESLTPQTVAYLKKVVLVAKDRHPVYVTPPEFL